MSERVIEADGVRLCTEAFGDPADPAVVLIGGSGSSLVLWEDDFVRALADAGRFVIRYDHRDTGRSTTYEPGRPGYTGADLARDAVRVLDGYDIDAAHFVGVSMGGALAQVVALDFPERVLSLVVISTSFAVPSGRDLPVGSERFGRFLSETAEPTDEESAVDYLVAYQRVLAGPERPFDEDAARALFRHHLERGENFATGANHALAGDDGRQRGPVSSITAPTLVAHGTADPMFPIEHGEALATDIPNATLLRLEGAGHGVERADWPLLTRALLDHTA